MLNEKNFSEKASQSLEKFILTELGAESLEDVSKAIENKTWSFKIQPQELWKKIADYFEQPLSPEEITDLLTGGKTEEQIREGLKTKQWPFTVSETDMRSVSGAVNKNED